MRTGISCLRAEPLNVWHGLTDIAGIAKSSEGHPGGCPFSLAFWEPPCGRREGAGSLRERGLGAAFPPFQQPAGRARNPPAIESAEKRGTPQRLGRGRGKEGRWLRDGGLVFLDTLRFRRVSPWRGRLRSLRLGAARP